MGKARYICAVILIALLAILLAGCGGSSSPGHSEGLGTVRGTVQEFPTSQAVRSAGGQITVSIDGTDLSTLANSDGSFVLENVPPGVHTLVAQTSGRASAVVVSVEPGKETNVGEIVLQDAGQISGLVTSAKTHEPIPDALVTITELVYTITQDQMPHPVRVCSTNELGSYTISGLPAGEYLVIISKDGYESTSLVRSVSAGTTTPGDAALQPVASGEMGSVEGTAYTQTNGGELTPIAGVIVRLASTDVILMDVPPLPVTATDEGGSTVTVYPGPWPIPYPRDYYAYTGEDGKYRIDGVIPGDYMAVAIRPGFEMDSHPVTITANGVATVDFTLVLFVPKVGTIEGTVTNSETHQPIAGAEVYGMWGAVPMGVQSGGAVIMPDDGTIMFCLTDEQGHYKLVVPAEVTAIEAWADGFEFQEVPVTVTVDSTVTADIELVPASDTVPPGGGGGSEPPPPPATK